jgi:hypothetical protein
MEFSVYVITMDKLNLHRTRHEDVKRKIIHFIEDNWDSGRKIEIITGYSNKMQELVIGVLEEYNLSYRIGREFDYNKGYLIVSME